MSDITNTTPAPENEELRFTYRNWRGEVAERRVRASTVRMIFGSTEWHPEPQWLLCAIDLDKKEGRDFAWSDIVRPAPATLADEMRAEVEALAAKVRSLAPHGSCGCSYDTPDDMCLHHSPQLVAAIARAEVAEAKLAAISPVKPEPAGRETEEVEIPMRIVPGHPEDRV